MNQNINTTYNTIYLSVVQTLTIILIISFSIFIGCNSHKSKEYFKHPKKTDKNIIYNKINIDIIYLDSISSSYVGFSKIVSDSIYFIDEMFCRIYTFNANGRYISHHLSRGKGPKEIPAGRIEAYVSLSENKHLFIGPSYDFYTFNKNWDRINNKRIDWKKKNNRKEMLKSPKPNMRGLYAPVYYKLILRENNGYVYFPISSQHPTFNYINSKEYYKNARILAKMNINTGEVVKLMGRYSPIFQDYNFIPQFSLPNYDIAPNGDFYVSFEPDSLIYLYNNNYEIKEVFGRKGKNMNTSYKEIFSIKSFKSNYKNERETKGFYNWIEYNDQYGILFRNYKKGVSSHTNGLQIYKNGTLVGDFDIPKDFRKIIGNIGPYFYSNIVIDEANEKMKIYRFKLNKE